MVRRQVDKMLKCHLNAEVLKGSRRVEQTWTGRPRRRAGPDSARGESADRRRPAARQQSGGTR